MGEYICPNCKNPVYDEEALLCHFCGESLQRANQGFLGKMKYANQKIVWFFIVFFVILSFIFLVLR